MRWRSVKKKRRLTKATRQWAWGVELQAMNETATSTAQVRWEAAQGLRPGCLARFASDIFEPHSGGCDVLNLRPGVHVYVCVCLHVCRQTDRQAGMQACWHTSICRYNMYIWSRVPCCYPLPPPIWYGSSRTPPPPARPEPPAGSCHRRSHPHPDPLNSPDTPAPPPPGQANPQPTISQP